MPPPARPLRIAFYAPLKAPGHPTPSGDRLMARMLMAALGQAGHEVSLASDLRAYLRDPGDQTGWDRLQADARAEAGRIAAVWQARGAPDLWFCYHPYYKAPDLIGPELARRFGLPCVTCEASLSARRDIGIWAAMQARVSDSVRGAALNLCLTGRDRAGLAVACPGARLARLRPFLDTAPFGAAPVPEPGHLVTVAMMRPGDKEESYRRLAGALARLPPALDWRLSVAGDGPLRAEVEALFARLPQGRVTFLGQFDQAGVAALLARGAALVWPGCGEAYGLCYLEAQAAGLPVVAQAEAGVPEVVVPGETGLLTPPGSGAAAEAALAGAIARLLEDGALRARMAATARARVRSLHSIETAALRLDRLLRDPEGEADAADPDFGA